MKIELELTEDQAWRVAQYLKRVTWEDVERRTVHKNDAQLTMNALVEIQKCINSAGFNPR